MKQFTLLKCSAVWIALFLFNGCSQSNADKAATTSEANPTTVTKPDNQQMKTEIQALETEWANADNAGNVAALAAFYSDDAVSLANNQPMLTGNDAIKKDLEASMAKRPKGSTVAYDVLDAFGCENYVTEVGKITRKDSTGKAISTGKYMAIWEKRNGKWICIRDISNDDAKQK